MFSGVVKLFTKAPTANLTVSILNVVQLAVCELLNTLNHNLFRICIQKMYPQNQQIRMKWANAHMKKDHRKRQTVKAENITRLRINALRKNTILPHEIREVADVEIHALNRDSSMVALVSRCAVTSRPRGNVLRWRLSRFIFRHLADYNKLSGVQRAMW